MTQIAGMSTCVWSVRSDRRPHRPRPPESGHSAGAATSKLFDSRLTRVGVTSDRMCHMVKGPNRANARKQRDAAKRAARSGGPTIGVGGWGTLYKS